MVQIEEVIAADDFTPKAPADDYVDDYIDSSKDDCGVLAQGEEAKA
jgi:hypothetical protein